MIEFYITGQSIRYASPVIAANSRNYLTARFHFKGEDWTGFSKWAHFRQGETVYDLNLVNDEITAEMGLNLSIGAWEVYLTGNMGESRLTTVPVWLRVMESGLVAEPLNQIPMTVAEQVDSKATLALQKAQAVESAIESGELDGRGFEILGYYGSFEELQQAVTEPRRGDVYGVGESYPYDIYVYNEMSGSWVNNGSIQGVKGDAGEDGANFIPAVDVNGNLSWSNDKGLPNPATVNIRGGKGDKGDTGSPGQSPFEKAVEEGFSGTEATFNWSLAHLASHADQHKAGGTDQLELETDNLKNGCVSTAKLADKSVSRAKLGEDAAYSPVLSVSAGRAVTAGDGGKTIIANGAGADHVFTVSKAEFSTWPMGMELALLWAAGNSVEIRISGSGFYFADAGSGERQSNATARLDGPFAMAALKKIGEDLLLITGNVEVTAG